MPQRSPNPRSSQKRPLSVALPILGVLLFALLVWRGGLIREASGPQNDAQPQASPAIASPQALQAEPTAEPTPEPTAAPAEEPTAEPTAEPTIESTSEPSPQPSPTPAPTATVARASDLPVIAYADLPPEAHDTIALIDAGGPFPFGKDGSTFQNREGILPDKPRGYYGEYTVITPGSADRGARRIVAGEGGEMYYTDDHYASFREVMR